MRRRTAAVLLCAALLLSACAVDATPESSSPDTTADPGRELTFVVRDTVTNEDDTTSPIELQLEARLWGAGEDYVVLGHMRPADMSSWFDFARLLAAEGYTALAFNFRGYGESEGNEGDFKVGDDTRAAIAAAFEHGARRVHLIGASMGGTGAIAAAATERIGGTVTLSAPDEFQGVVATEKAKAVKGPILLIAAEDDGTAAVDAAAIAAAAEGPTELVVLSGAQHGTNLFSEHGEEITQLILDFLDAA